MVFPWDAELDPWSQSVLWTHVNYRCVYMVFCLITHLYYPVFLGPVGVGLNELKRKLLISDTQHYGVTVPRKFPAT